MQGKQAAIMRDRLKSKVYLDALAQRIAMLAAPMATANALTLLELLRKTRQIANGLP
jgi:hypothetical protein